MNGAYGEGMRAAEQAWRYLEYGAWVFIGGAAVVFIWRLLRA